MDTLEHKIYDKCGVFGLMGKTESPIRNTLYYALFALQHRGQESCGMAVGNADGSIVTHKSLGLAGDVFCDPVLNNLPENADKGICHVRYAGAAENSHQNSQPLSVLYTKGTLSIALNGQITNACDLRRELNRDGAVFQTTSDTEVIAFLVARERKNTQTLEEAIKNIMPRLKGAYAILFMSPNKLIAVRDPFGLKPLCLGKIDKAWAFSSESCALEAVAGKFIRDVAPGEIITVSAKGMKEYAKLPAKKCSALCIFEFIYFARPDSVIDGQGVDASRQEAGRLLAKQAPTVCDVVFGVPDSGLSAAMGYAAEAGVPYSVGLIKNRYIGRTFIQPAQKMREKSVSLKLNALRENISGKRVVMVDDSIVRGTTTKQLVAMVKRAGAKEVHLRIASPPFKHICRYGTDVPAPEDLIANRIPLDKLAAELDCTSVEFLDAENLKFIAPNCNLRFCTACFDGLYPDKK